MMRIGVWMSWWSTSPLHSVLSCKSTSVHALFWVAVVCRACSLLRSCLCYELLLDWGSVVQCWAMLCLVGSESLCWASSAASCQFSWQPQALYRAASLTSPPSSPHLCLCVGLSVCLWPRLDFDGLENGEEGFLDKAKSWSRSIEDLHHSSAPPFCNTLVRSARQSVLRYVASLLLATPVIASLC